MVGLEAHWPPLLQDGLVSGVEPLPYSRSGVVVVVVMVTRRGVVVVVVVDGLVGVVVFLLPQEVRVEVSARLWKNRYRVFSSTFMIIIETT